MQKYFSLTARLWKLLKDFHKHFYIQLASTVVQQAIVVFSIFLTAKTLDTIVHKNFENALILTFAIFILAITRIIIAYYTELHAQDKIDFSIPQYLQEYSFKKIFKLNVKNHLLRLCDVA